MFFVFDVESVGLHGEGFSVGFTVQNVMDGSRSELDAGYYACNRDNAAGDDEGRKWIAENVPPQQIICLTPRDVRERFWGKWMEWKEAGAVMVADCAWPVEARFLVACVDDDPKTRCFEGPYPLHDVASFRMAAGLDPLATVDRMPDELPIHDPLADARQSARLLIEALNKIVYID